MKTQWIVAPLAALAIVGAGVYFLRDKSETPAETVGTLAAADASTPSDTALESTPSVEMPPMPTGTFFYLRVDRAAMRSLAADLNERTHWDRVLGVPDVTQSPAACPGLNADTVQSISLALAFSKDVTVQSLWNLSFDPRTVRPSPTCLLQLAENVQSTLKPDEPNAGRGWRTDESHWGDFQNDSFIVSNRPLTEALPALAKKPSQIALFDRMTESVKASIAHLVVSPAFVTQSPDREALESLLAKWMPLRDNTSRAMELAAATRAITLDVFASETSITLSLQLESTEATTSNGVKVLQYIRESFVQTLLDNEDQFRRAAELVDLTRCGGLTRRDLSMAVAELKTTLLTGDASVNGPNIKLNIEVPRNHARSWMAITSYLLSHPKT